MEALRRLDFDDLLLLQLLDGGSSVSAAAQTLKISQPAVTQRLRKIEEIFSIKLIERQGRSTSLTEAARPVARRAVDALSVLQTKKSAPANLEVNIGTRPEAGWTWVWPALRDLRKSHPHYCFQCFMGSGEEILQRLSRNTLEGVITSAPYAEREFVALELATEHYVFVATPAIAKTIKNIEDLRKHTLVEHDRGFPFQRYLAPDLRSKMKFQDVWVLGNTRSMTEALMAGLGVGIVPLYIAEFALKKKILSHVLKGQVQIGYDCFRLLYRRGSPTLDEPMKLLADKLRKIGLRDIPLERSF